MHKICLYCKEDYKATGYSQKFCKSCGELQKTKYAKEYHLTHYVRKGYNQKNTSNNNWKGGIGIYRQLGNPLKKKGFIVHHKDRNRYNNRETNLELMSKKEHQIEHRCWENLPKGRVLAKLKRIQSAKARRDKTGRFVK